MKKLVLYSDQVPPLTDKIDDRLKTLFEKPVPKIGFIPSTSDRERKYYRDRKAFYRRLGMELDVYFELDDGYRPGLAEALLECDAIHLSGGNTYYFLHRLRSSVMTDTLVRYAARGGVLIGVSAGAILMTPDISTSSFSGDEFIESETDFSGLGLVDFLFVPHFNDKPFSLDDLKRFSKEKQRVIYAAEDSGGIVVINNEVECIGDVVRVDERR